jgi:para-nitrobenzyl esterase
MKISSLGIVTFIGACALVCECSTPSPGVVSDDAPVAHTPAGAMRGVREGDAHVFRAIPYALPPIGQTQLAATRDVIFGWTAERLVRKQAAIGQASFLYYFSHDYPSAAAAHLSVFHGREVPFVFGTFDATPTGWPVIPDTAEERRLSEAMLDYWTTFARRGRPTATNSPAWEPFMCRRRQDGTQSWDWRAGSTAPVLPKPTPTCDLNRGISGQN